MKNKGTRILKGQQRLKSTREVVETAIRLSKTKKGSWKAKRGEFQKTSSYGSELDALSF